MINQQRTILLTGVNGQVGHELNNQLQPYFNVVGLARHDLDLTREDEIRRVVQEVKPHIIINPAAYTAVDKAESEQELAWAVNTNAPGILAEEAARLHALLVHFSTDYVYDGGKAEPYIENDEPNPLSVYGKTKLAGESAILTVGCPHLIFRTSWVYGAYGKNFFKTILRLAQEKDHLNIVGDQYGAPTSSISIAEATITALLHFTENKNGIYHLADSGYTTWHGFATSIIEKATFLGLMDLKTSPQNVLPITTAEYPTPAIRPVNSRLNCRKAEEVLGIKMPRWDVALDKVISMLK